MIRAKFSRHACRTARKALIHVYAYLTDSNACAHSTSGHAKSARRCVCVRACVLCMRVCCMCFPAVENFEVGGSKSWHGARRHRHPQSVRKLAPTGRSRVRVVQCGGHPPQTRRSLKWLRPTGVLRACAQRRRSACVSCGLGIVCWGYGLVREVKPYASPPPDPGSRGVLLL